MVCAVLFTRGGIHMNVRSPEGVLIDLKKLDEIATRLGKLNDLGALVSNDSPATLAKELRVAVADLRQDIGIGILKSVK